MEPTRLPQMVGGRVNINDLTVPGLLARLADQRPDAPVLTDLIGQPRSLTPGEWQRRAEVLAHELRARGVGRGLRVVVVCEADWTIYAVAYVAVQMTGATAVPVSGSMGREQIGRIAERSRAVGVMWDSEEGYGIAVLHAMPSVLARPDGPRLGAHLARPDDVAEVLFTSGTTGTPRGIAATHANLVHSLTGALRGDRWSDEAVAVLHSLPAGSNGGQSMMLQALSPVPHTILTAPFLAREILELVETQRPDELVIVPSYGTPLVRAA